MKKTSHLIALVGLAGLVGLLTPAPASGTGFASDNVTHVKTVPVEAGYATGGRLVGGHFYVAGLKSFSIYDVSDAENPQLLSITPHLGSFPTEDVDTNGKILLIQDESGVGRSRGGVLHVYDVEDKAAPKKVGELAGVNSHTFSCVLKCRYAYGSRGHIVDLKDPSQPKLVGSWGSLPPNDGFDVTEVAPGLVLTSSRTMFFLDARKNPLKPKVLAVGGTQDNRVIHSNRWPNGGRDRFYLVQGETPLSRFCNENSGAFMTWDASKWRKTHTFSVIDEFRVDNGTYTDGSPPVGIWGCTNMWFDDHPKFRNGGSVAAAFFEHGTRFLDVDKKGEISEAGYFMPHGGNTIASYWITNDLVYAIDMNRGIDILRFKP